MKTVLPPFLKKWGWKKSLDDFLLYWHTSEHNIDEELIKYIKQQREKGIICCLATNQTKYRFAYILNEMGFAKVFDKVYASAHLGFRKPDLEFYQKVFDDLKVFNKNEIIFWDDDERNVKAAKEFGIYTELYVNFVDFKVKMQKYI